MEYPLGQLQFLVYTKSLCESVRQTENTSEGWVTEILYSDWLFFSVPWYALLTDYTGVGCYRDTSDRAIPTLEDTDSVLDGSAFSYQKRQNAIVKCAVAARKRGFPAFALQDGGWCAASSKALDTFNKYGNSSDCQNDGRGGHFANNVYVFQDETNSKVFFSSIYNKKHNDLNTVNVDTAFFNVYNSRINL